MSVSGPQRYTVIYDGDCRVCSRLVDVLRRWDHGRRLEIVPSQQSGVTTRFPWISVRAYADALQLIASNGTTWEGARAIDQLLDVLPRGPWIAWAFRIPYARVFADRAYRWFARNRYRLGCAAHCRTHPL